MQFNPDQITILEWSLGDWGTLKISATLLFTWIVMAVLAGGARLVTRRLSSGPSMSRWQALLEVIVESAQGQIREIGQREPTKFLPFVGTLFLFIAVSNMLIIVPGYRPPTGSLSTTTALAICVLIAVPIYGVSERGLLGYAKKYIQPTPFMLPFNIMGEISRTIALAIRLYGNVMSGTIIVAILIGIAPFLFPILIELLGLLTGLIQAYIFAILAMVYIASATGEPLGEREIETTELDAATRSTED